MLSDVNFHDLTLAARCPVSGCWPSCPNNYTFTFIFASIYNTVLSIALILTLTPTLTFQNLINYSPVYSLPIPRI